MKAARVNVIVFIIQEHVNWMLLFFLLNDLANSIFILLKFFVFTDINNLADDYISVFTCQQFKQFLKFFIGCHCF